jgi:predicted XRE-type DNA-binding protein
MKSVQFCGKSLDDLRSFPAMKSQKFTSIWDAIEDTPQAAASMKARSTLLMELATVIQKRGMTQAEAAELFGVTQPRISDLTRGKINLFSLDMLMNMASTAGMSPVVKLSKPKALPVKRTARTRSALAA